jgi:hypothetical protein
LTKLPNAALYALHSRKVQAAKLNARWASTGHAIKTRSRAATGHSKLTVANAGANLPDA